MTDSAEVTVADAYSSVSDSLVKEIDAFMEAIRHRNLVETSAVVDFCLDMRQVIDKGYQS